MRVSFLKLFTQELIINSLPGKREIIEEEIIKAQTSFIQEEKAKEERAKKELIIPRVIYPKIEIPIPSSNYPNIENFKDMQKAEEINLSSYQASEKIASQETNTPAKIERTKALEISSPPRITREITRPILPMQNPNFIVYPEFTQQASIDLGKINFFLKDLNSSQIECPGPDKFLLVKGFNMQKTTNLSLSNDEINEIIRRFSEATKMPIIEGVFKAALGNLTITAVISDIAGSRFIITKHQIMPRFSMPYSPRPM